MANITHKPVIFLALANDRDDRVNFLRNLPKEARQIREPLQRARRDGLCEIVELANATADDSFRVFQDPEYRGRIAVFHYVGHANGYQLLLESASVSPHAVDASGLAAFLGSNWSSIWCSSMVARLSTGAGVAGRQCVGGYPPRRARSKIKWPYSFSSCSIKGWRAEAFYERSVEAAAMQLDSTARVRPRRWCASHRLPRRR